MTFPDSLELGAFDEASKLLDYAVSAALDNQIGIPALQFVTQGQAVWDCEQVSATMVSVSTGLPGSTRPGAQAIVNCPLTWQVTVELAIVRCQVAAVGQDGSPPNASQLLADARQSAADTLILQSAASSRASEQFGGVVCSISYPAPSGEFTATVGRYQVAIVL